MKRILLVIAFIAVVLCCHSQKTLKGKVLDANTNTPLTGATISFSGKGGTTTDNEGVFSVNCETVKKNNRLLCWL